MSKKFIYFIAALAIVSCKNESKDYVTFSGEITNKISDSLVIRSSEYSKTIKVNEDGTFSDTLQVNTGLYAFSHGRESTSIYLKNGYDIKMTLDTKEFDESAKYSGVGSENSNYLSTKYMNSEKVSGGDAPTLYALNESEFLEKINKIRDTKDEFFKKSKLEGKFAEKEAKNLKFDHLLSIQNYPSYHEYYGKKEGFNASEGFLDPLKDIDYTNEKDYKNIDSYKRLVSSHFLSKINNPENIESAFQELINIKSNTIKNDLAKNLGSAYNITPNNEHHEIYYNSILKMSNDTEFKENLTKKYKNLLTLSKGLPSPKFMKYENHKGGVTSLDDLKGKYVYVDVWATWCGPCKREIPFLKEVEKKYHNKNIEFVSLSVDAIKDHDKWVKMVSEKELTGIQLFSDKSWKSEFVTDYGIEGIPRFILIDPAGNIVSANAPRPSSPDLIKMFDEENI
jgi:thiol-disulfide isomerase/thioredoxin